MNRKTDIHLVHPKYRPDIDGLRAIAILFVVGYHAFPDLIKGGFIGVDIFFVISGYLISTIIFSNLERDRFSLVEFYIRRIKRIFPSLIAVMISSLSFGWFFLFNDEFKELGKHVVGGAAFVSNFLLWKEAGYFDSVALTKPMQHLWSLAIEEQFYIFWPLVLMTVWKRKWSFLWITLTVAALSFIASIYLISKNSIAAFYLPIPRFWELMIGGGLAYISLHRKSLNSRYKNIQSALGFLLVVIGLVVVNENRAFPGWWALLPTIGAFFIISSGPTALLNKYVLSNKVLVWIGLISYPLYLWHWPLLVFANIVEGGIPSTAILITIVTLSFALAWLSYRFIEHPIRFGNHRNLPLSLLALMVVTGCVGYACYKADGFKGHKSFIGEEQLIFADYFENSSPQWRYFEKTDLVKNNREECNFYDLDKYRLGQATTIPRNKIDESCYKRNAHFNVAVFLWGDSHVQRLNYGLRNNLPSNWQILQVASSACDPSLEIASQSDLTYCSISNKFALTAIAETKPDVVIVAQNSGHDVDRFNEIAARLKATGVKKVVLVGPSPHWTKDLPKIILRQLWQNTPRRTFTGIDKISLRVNSNLQKDFKQSDDVVYVNIIDLLCNSGGCITYLGDDIKTGITSSDYGHLTPIASNYVAKNILVPVITGISNVQTH